MARLGAEVVDSVELVATAVSSTLSSFRSAGKTIKKVTAAPSAIAASSNRINCDLDIAPVRGSFISITLSGLEIMRQLVGSQSETTGHQEKVYKHPCPRAMKK